MSTTKKLIAIDYNKAFTWLLGLTLTCAGWFAKVSFEKLDSIDTKVQSLLVKTAVQEEKIKSLEEQINKAQPIKKGSGNKDGNIVVNKEAVLPENLNKNKRLAFNTSK